MRTPQIACDDILRRRYDLSFEESQRDDKFKYVSGFVYQTICLMEDEFGEKIKSRQILCLAIISGERMYALGKKITEMSG